MTFISFLVLIVSLSLFLRVQSSDLNDDFNDLDSYFYTEQAKNDFVSALPNITSPHRSKHFSGYIEIRPSIYWHYIYIESENDPLNDPLMYWSNGGPGCSGLIGLFTEHGPWRPVAGPKLVRNEYSWTRQANIVYIEAPEGVGFSKTYGYVESRVYTDFTTSLNFLTFFTKFLVRFPYLSGFFSEGSTFNLELMSEYDLGNSKQANALLYKPPPIYLSSESYGGHYIPQWTLTLLEVTKQFNQFSTDLVASNNIYVKKTRDEIMASFHMIKSLNITLHNEIAQTNFNNPKMKKFYEINYLDIFYKNLQNFDGFLLGNPYVSFESGLVSEIETLWGHQLLPLPAYKIWRDSSCFHRKNFFFPHDGGSGESIIEFLDETSMYFSVNRDNNNLAAFKKNIYEYNKKHRNNLRSEYLHPKKSSSYPGFQLSTDIDKFWKVPYHSNHTSHGETACLSLLYALQMYVPNVNPYAVDHFVCSSVPKSDDSAKLSFVSPQAHAIKSKYFHFMDQTLGTQDFSKAYKKLLTKKFLQLSDDENPATPESDDPSDSETLPSSSPSQSPIPQPYDPRARLYDPCVMNNLKEYMNLQEVQQALNIFTNNGGNRIKWMECNEQINANWAGGDFFANTAPLFSQIFQHKSRSSNFHGLIFSGDNDGIVGTQGTQEWLHSLNFTYDLLFQPWFQPQDLRTNTCYSSSEAIEKSRARNPEETSSTGSCTPPFLTGSSEPLGFVTNFFNMSFALATVRFSGHEAPLYQPDRSYAMFHNFINKRFYSTKSHTLNYLDYDTDEYPPSTQTYYLSYALIIISLLFVLGISLRQAMLTDDGFDPSPTQASTTDTPKRFPETNSFQKVSALKKSFTLNKPKTKKNVKFSQVEFIKLSMADDDENDSPM